MKFTSKPSQFTLNCSCEKNWHNANNFVSFNDSINSKKAKGVLSSTFYNLIFPTKSNEIRPIGRSDDYFYALSNPNSCELYWNNYLAKSFNNSLSERVIQWMDLKRKQKKHDQKFQLSIEEVSLDSTERIFSGKTFIDKITPNKCPEDQEQEPRKSVPNEKESGARKTASAKYRNTETNKGKDEINKVPSTERKDNRKPDCHNKVKADKKNLSVDEKEAETLSKNPISENRSNESATISISAKIDPNLWETDNLQNSIASYLQFPIPETSKLVVSAPEFKSAFPVKSIIPKKMARDSYNGFFQKSKNLFSRWESDTDEEKDFNIKAMKVLEKNNFSGKIKKSETVGTLDGYVDVAKNATKLHKSEFKETSIGKSNAPEENLLSQRHNDLFCLSESRKTCPMEKNLGRPQLHIFIPSLSSRDKVEESLSECESFLNETY